MEHPVDALPMPAAYFKLTLDWIGTTPARRRALLEGTGVEPDALEGLGNAVTVGQQLRQIRNANRLMPAGWGLALGSRLNASTHGPLGFGAVSAPDLRAALELLERYAHVRNPSLDVNVMREGTLVRLVLRTRYALLEEEQQPLFEIFLLSLQAILEAILGRELDQGSIEIAGRPAHAALYRDHFHVEVRFDAPEVALVIPAAWLGRSGPFADPELHAISVRRLEEMAETLRSDLFVASRVAQLLTLGGDAGLPIEVAARRLGYSSRTLIRRLRESGVTYRELRDEHRRRRGEALLRDSRLTMGEVAARLGYEDPSNFARACHRWFDGAPKAVRVRLQQVPTPAPPDVRVGQPLAISP